MDPGKEALGSVYPFMFFQGLSSPEESPIQSAQYPVAESGVGLGHVECA